MLTHGQVVRALAAQQSSKRIIVIWQPLQHLLRLTNLAFSVFIAPTSGKRRKRKRWTRAVPRQWPHLVHLRRKHVVEAPRRCGAIMSRMHCGCRRGSGVDEVEDWACAVGRTGRV